MSSLLRKRQSRVKIRRQHHEGNEGDEEPYHHRQQQPQQEQIPVGTGERVEGERNLVRDTNTGIAGTGISKNKDERGEGQGRNETREYSLGGKQSGGRNPSNEPNPFSLPSLLSDPHLPSQSVSRLTTTNSSSKTNNSSNNSTWNSAMASRGDDGGVPMGGPPTRGLAREHTQVFKHNDDIDAMTQGYVDDDEFGGKTFSRVFVESFLRHVSNTMNRL